MAAARLAGQLGQHLRDAGYAEPGIASALDGHAVGRATPGARALALHRLHADPPLGDLVEFWYLGASLDIDRAQAAHHPVSLAELESAGLLHIDSASVAPTARITPVADVLVVHDPDGLRRPDQEFVLGIGGSTRTLAALTIRRTVQQALDIGTGSGLHALFASEHAEHVVGTDISERALWFAQFNAALNDRAGIEFRRGDAFQPVAGESFDLVVANPPWVISPDRHFTFRDTGSEGDSISRDVVRAAPQHLTRGGHATILVSWVVRDGEDPAQAPRSWVDQLPCDSLVLHHDSIVPADYADQFLMESSQTAPAAYTRALDRWVRYNERLGAVALGTGAVIMRRTDGPPRVRVERMTTGADDGGPQLERILDSFDGFDGPDGPALLEARFVPADDYRIEQHLSYTAGKYEAHPVILRLTRSAGVAAKVPPDLLEVVFLLDGEQSVGALIDHLAEVREQSVSELRAAVLPVLIQLHERGFVTAAAGGSRLVGRGKARSPTPDLELST
jgi:methylase of polypeptide subunit release factors